MPADDTIAALASFQQLMSCTLESAFFRKCRLSLSPLQGLQHLQVLILCAGMYDTLDMLVHLTKLELHGGQIQASGDRSCVKTLRASAYSSWRDPQSSQGWVTTCEPLTHLGVAMAILRLNLIKIACC